LGIALLPGTERSASYLSSLSTGTATNFSVLCALVALRGNRGARLALVKQLILCIVFNAL
jgi:hypothetical protein